MSREDESDEDCVDDLIRLFDNEQDRVFKYSEIISSFTIEDPGYRVDAELQELQTKPQTTSFVGMQKSAETFLANLNTGIDVQISKEYPHSSAKVTNFENFLRYNQCVKSANTNKESYTLSSADKAINLPKQTVNVVKNATEKCYSNEEIQLSLGNKIRVPKQTNINKVKRFENNQREKVLKTKNTVDIEANKCLIGMNIIQKNVLVNNEHLVKNKSSSKDIKTNVQGDEKYKKNSNVDIYERIIGKAFQNLENLVGSSHSNPNDINKNGSVGLRKEGSKGNATVIDSKSAISTYYSPSAECPESVFSNGYKIPKNIGRRKSLHIPPESKVKLNSLSEKGSLQCIKPITTNLNTLKVNDDNYLHKCNEMKNTDSATQSIYRCMRKNKVNNFANVCENEGASENAGPSNIEMRTQINSLEINNTYNDQVKTSNNSVLTSKPAAKLKNRRNTESLSTLKDQQTSGFNICVKKIFMNDKTIPHYHSHVINNQTQIRKTDENLADSLLEINSTKISAEQCKLERTNMETKQSENIDSIHINFINSVPQQNLSSITVKLNKTNKEIAVSENTNNNFESYSTTVLPKPFPKHHIGSHKNIQSIDKCKPIHTIQQSHNNSSSNISVQRIVSGRSTKKLNINQSVPQLSYLPPVTTYTSIPPQYAPHYKFYNNPNNSSYPHMYNTMNAWDVNKLPAAANRSNRRTLLRLPVHPYNIQHTSVTAPYRNANMVSGVNNFRSTTNINQYRTLVQTSAYQISQNFGVLPLQTEGLPYSSFNVSNNPQEFIGPENKKASSSISNTSNKLIKLQQQVSTNNNTSITQSIHIANINNIKDMHAISSRSVINTTCDENVTSIPFTPKISNHAVDSNDPNAEHNVVAKVNRSNKCITLTRHPTPYIPEHQMLTTSQTSAIHQKQIVNAPTRDRNIENKKVTCTESSSAPNNLNQISSDTNQKIPIKISSTESQKVHTDKQLNKNLRKTNLQTPDLNENIIRHPGLVKALDRVTVVGKISHNVDEMLINKSSLKPEMNKSVDVNKIRPKKEYSPPILPILSYETILEIIASNNHINYYRTNHLLLNSLPVNKCATADNETHNRHSENVNNKRKLNDANDKTVKKISLQEYKRRTSVNNDTKEIS